MMRQEQVVKEKDGLCVEKDQKEGEQRDSKSTQNVANPQNI